MIIYIYVCVFIYVLVLSLFIILYLRLISLICSWDFLRMSDENRDKLRFWHGSPRMGSGWDLIEIGSAGVPVQQFIISSNISSMGAWEQKWIIVLRNWFLRIFSLFSRPMVLPGHHSIPSSPNPEVFSLSSSKFQSWFVSIVSIADHL